MANLRWHTQTLSIPTADTSTSLLVNFENDKILFDVPESTSRTFIQNKVSAKKIASIFISKLDQETAGGLFGSLLGIRESGVKHVDIYGPEGTEHFLACGRYFTRRDRFTVKCHSVTSFDQPALKSNTLTVYGFPLTSVCSTKKRKRVDSNESDGASNARGHTSLDWCNQVIDDMFRGPDYKRPTPTSGAPNSPSPAWNHRPLPPPLKTANDTSMAWLGVGPYIRGKFLVQKAKELGVKPGKDFGLLTNGKSVWVGDKEVRPEDCVEKGQDPSAFLYIQASLSQLPSIEAFKSSLNEWLKKSNIQLKMCFHLVDEPLLQEPSYQKWMHDLPHCQHFISNRQHCANPISFTPAMLLQLRLSRLDPSTFAVPYYSLQPPSSLSEIVGLPSFAAPLTQDTVLSGTDAAAPPASLQRRTFPFELGSQEALREEATLKVETASPDNAAIQQRAKEAWQAYLGLVNEGRKAVQKAEAERNKQSPSPGDHLLVTTTGTGSATPSKYRNVSSTLVEDPQSNLSFLLDCGEGTWGQLVRRFGKLQAVKVARELSFVFVSHMHGDHHAGLANLLRHRVQNQSAQPSRLVIICPPHCKTYLYDLSQHQDLGLEHVDFVDTNSILRRKDLDQKGIKDLLQRHSLTNISTTLVDHRARCFGLAVQSASGWKVVFSGDTRPCQALVALGKDASLLIHEATIDDSMPQVARNKGHSTFGEALQIAKEMRARTCLLTHFSQRYPKLPPLAEDGRYAGDVGIAFDGMRIAVGDIWKMTYWRDALEALFRETEEADDTSVNMMIDDSNID